MLTTTTSHDELIAEYAPVVKRVAHHMMGRLPPSVEVDDLIQVGLIGLLDAIDKYDDTLGANFETFATYRIRGAMLDELRDIDWLPRSVRRKLRAIEATIVVLEQRYGRPPTEIELAAEMHIPLLEYQQILQEGRCGQLLHYEDFNSLDDGDFFDRHAIGAAADPLALLMDERLMDRLTQSIGALPEKEKLVMGLYYEQDLNLKEIGAVLGVTESRVSQIHSQSIARLRTKLRTFT